MSPVRDQVPLAGSKSSALTRGALQPDEPSRRPVPAHPAAGWRRVRRCVHPPWTRWASIALRRGRRSPPSSPMWTQRRCRPPPGHAHRAASPPRRERYAVHACPPSPPRSPCSGRTARHDSPQRARARRTARGQVRPHRTCSTELAVGAPGLGVGVVELGAVEVAADRPTHPSCDQYPSVAQQGCRCVHATRGHAPGGRPTIGAGAGDTNRAWVRLRGHQDLEADHGNCRNQSDDPEGNRRLNASLGNRPSQGEESGAPDVALRRP